MNPYVYKSDGVFSTTNSKYSQYPENGDYIYDLKFVVIHSGTTDKRHYTCMTLDELGNCYYLDDDEWIAKNKNHYKQYFGNGAKRRKIAFILGYVKRTEETQFVFAEKHTLDENINIPTNCDESKINDSINNNINVDSDDNHNNQSFEDEDSSSDSNFELCCSSDEEEKENDEELTESDTEGNESDQEMEEVSSDEEDEDIALNPKYKPSKSQKRPIEEINENNIGPIAFKKNK